MADEDNNVTEKLTDPTEKMVMEPPKRKAAFDDLLKLGRYTKYLTIVFFLLLSAQSFQLLFMSFAGAKPKVEDFVCNGVSATEEHNITAELMKNIKELCKRRDEINAKGNNCSFKTSYKFGSVFETFDLECRPDLVTYSTSFQHTGLIFGTLISGYFANSIGRKKTLIADLVLLVTCLILSAFSMNIFVFTIIRFLVMMCAAGSHNVAHLFIIENMPPKWRSIIPTYLSYPVGFLVTAIVAKFSKDWLTLTYANAGITVLPIILLLFVIETPSFLFGRGNLAKPPKKVNGVKLENAGEDASETLLKQQGKECRRTAKNAAVKCDTFLFSRKSPEFESKWRAAAVQQRINEIASKMAAADSPPPKASCIGRLFSSPLFHNRRLLCFTMILSYCIIVLSTTTYATLMGMSGIPGEIWVNIALSAIISYLANWVAISAELVCGKMGHPMWAGRRQLHIGFATATLLLLIAVFFVELSGKAVEGNPGWQWAMRILAWSVVGTCTEMYIIHHVQSSETFPTPVRAVGCSIVQTCSRFGNALGPLLHLTKPFGSFIPYLILSILFLSELLLYTKYSFGFCHRNTEEEAVVRETKGKPKPDFMPNAGKNINDYLENVKLTEDDLAEFDENAA